jgi:class 3 adenylate cyclase
MSLEIAPHRIPTQSATAPSLQQEATVQLQQASLQTARTISAKAGDRNGEPRAERRLAAMFAGDGAGYSRLMGTDEESTRARLNAHRREFLEPKIAEHRGRIVSEAPMPL